MRIACATVRDAAIGVAVADRPEELTAFLNPGCAAVIWRRQPAPDFQAWVDSLEPSNLPRGRIVLRPEAIRLALMELCEAANAPQSSEREWLIEDAAALAEIFAELMRARYLRLRLQAVASNACCKFHIDAVAARLLCTYRGTGTQYGISADGQDPPRVLTVPTGAPILLRGTLWPKGPASGLLHRSPPIEGTGETR
ncbi:MAG: DUF1826 domain-containing protein, partial [Boseongicola sp. SB0676_bin_33]|nr:DUF1826 domain-containing protein [Boseongicola sp. SB0676_bin_33]